MDVTVQVGTDAGIARFETEVDVGENSAASMGVVRNDALREVFDKNQAELQDERDEWELFVDGDTEGLLLTHIPSVEGSLH